MERAWIEPSQADETTRTKQEHLFSNYRGLARKVAGTVSRKLKRPYHELMDEAESLLADAVCIKWHLYQPELGGPSTWLYKRIYWGLTNYCNGLRSKKIPLSITDTEELASPSPVTWLQDVCSELGEEGMALVQDIVWKLPASVGARTHCPKKMRRLIAQHLLDTGWKHETMAVAWHQIDEVLA